MPKPHTFPTLYDDLKTVRISFLAKHGYFKPNQIQTGTINWNKNGKVTGSIIIEVNTYAKNPYLELNYNCNEAQIKYRVQLVSAPSNLGKGVVWHFICPKTDKRCRKLHLFNGYFYHRSACGGGMYESQTQSKYYRALDKTLGVQFRSEHLHEQLYKKHFKKQYAGKPTKKYLKIMQQLQRSASIPYHEVERILMR